VLAAQVMQDYALQALQESTLFWVVVLIGQLGAEFHDTAVADAHPVPVGAIGDGVDGAGEHNAALVAVRRPLPILHDLRQHAAQTAQGPFQRRSWHPLKQVLHWQ
jgi:hypothetical protein